MRTDSATVRGHKADGTDFEISCDVIVYDSVEEFDEARGLGKCLSMANDRLRVEVMSNARVKEKGGTESKAAFAKDLLDSSGLSMEEIKALVEASKE